MARHEIVIHENTGATKDVAPYLGSYIAKETIRLINAVAAKVNNDASIKGKIKIVFIEHILEIIHDVFDLIVILKCSLHTDDQFELGICQILDILKSVYIVCEIFQTVALDEECS